MSEQLFDYQYERWTYNGEKHVRNKAMQLQENACMCVRACVRVCMYGCNECMVVCMYVCMYAFPDVCLYAFMNVRGSMITSYARQKRRDEADRSENEQ